MDGLDKQPKNKKRVGRWKKGESGNPKGRPKKVVYLTEVLREEIDKPVPEEICVRNPAARGKTWRQLIVFATMMQAVKGSPAAMREVWERLDGKVKDTVELSGIDGAPIKTESEIKHSFDHDAFARLFESVVSGDGDGAASENGP